MSDTVRQMDSTALTASETAPFEVTGQNGSAALHKSVDPEITVRGVGGTGQGVNHAPAPSSWPSLPIAPLAGEFPAAEALLRADRRKDEFLAILSHELRSPLASIQNALSILRAPPGEHDPVLRHKMYELIERQVGQITRLASGLLDVARITHGQLRLQRERIDLRAVLCNAIETLESDLGRRGHRLATTWPDNSIWVQADAGRLEQVFVNLLGNASKYTSDGGELAVSMQIVDQYAVVRVRDSGVGIAADAVPHIFNLFTQADPAATRSRSGLGIGLGLVRAIVDLHGGSVSAESAGLGQGSEFIVRLPC